MFNRLDTSDDRRIELAEFRTGLSFIALWGVSIPDEEVASTFASIDSNGGGFILFDEFAKWAITKSLDLEDDDDFEDQRTKTLDAVGYVAAANAQGDRK